MLPTDRLVLIDLENVVGFRPKPRTLRARITALLDAAGPHHHAVAAYAADDAEDDLTASALACLNVAPLRVPPRPDAAETALLAHARRMQAEGCMLFTICSSDRAFASLTNGESAQVDVLIWEGQPVSTKLEQVVNHVRRLPRPGAEASTAEPTMPTALPDAAAPMRYREGRPTRQPLDRLTAGLITGIGIALGHRLADELLSRRGKSS
ncbi:hypothetical protein LWC34_54700 [Kibdelosporangium philippinense]|uniref:NYN domain-containing protein n=1 Tax=Kibdelosporangium philippinense TaxID=211113 RepID=A0ABS8ZVP9_9PSEU|nr:hypothetical protein [Kibdelosporangium philippinense]MCE7011810.1 hypothetical protein [Kibdelosporangium philippinense]